MAAAEKLVSTSTYHAFTRIDPYAVHHHPPEECFLEGRYSSVFQGIMPDSGAANLSSAGEAQVAALIAKHPHLKVEPTSPAENRTIKFGKGDPSQDPRFYCSCNPTRQHTVSRGTH